MKFLLDANLPYSAKEVFPDEHSVVHVRDESLEQATDTKIAAWAKNNEAILVTRDLDFANEEQFPPSKHCGVIVLRLRSTLRAKQIKEALAAFLQSVDNGQLQNNLIIVEENRYRVRSRDN